MGVGLPKIEAPKGGPLDGLSELLGITGSQFSAGSPFDPKPYQEGSFPGKVQAIKAENWNKVFPYFFTIIGGEGNPKGFNSRTVTLMIPPSSINVTTQFASAVTATNNGILEENNGVIFRNISLSGTTGVWPKKPTQPKTGAQGTITKVVANLFPGAVSAIRNVASSVRNTVASVTGESTTPRVPRDANGEIADIFNTGYYQFWVLHNFFVAYAESKKKRANKNLKLVFGSAKDNMGYVCTPMSFDLRRDASNPLLYRYSITLKAWDLTTVNQPSAIDVLSDLPTPDNVNAIKAVTNTLVAARETIFQSRNVLSGVHSDFANIMNVYTQGTLVAKEFAGVVEDIRDFPQVFNNNKEVLLTGSNNRLVQAMKDAFTGTPGQGVGTIEFTSVDEEESQHPSGSMQSNIDSANGGAVSTGSRTTPGGEDRTVGNARLNQAKGALDAALNNSTFLQTPISEIDLPPSVEDQIQSARDDAQALTSGQVRELASDMREISDNFAQNVGFMDSVYAETYGLPAPLPTSRVPTEEDILTAVALEESSQAFLSTLGTGQVFPERDSDPFASANNSLQEDDQVSSPGSAIPFIFPRGSSLELIAQQFLGNPLRAREIALLNSLRAPYIDERGFTKDITGADGRTFVITGNENIAINQVIVISGTSVSSTRRRILNIADIGGNLFRVTVDGPANLAMYPPSQSPQLYARIPGTVGPGDVILLPAGEIPEDALATRPSPLYNRLSQAEKVFKIDLAIDPKGNDLLVSAAGDVKRSYGYANAVQAIRLSLDTEKGELELHPDYGLSVPIGGRNSDTSINDMKRLVQERITADPRFVSAETDVQVNGSQVNVEIVAHGALGTGAIPVEFEIGKV